MSDYMIYMILPFGPYSERHDISDQVDRSAPVLDNPGVIVEKSAENIDDLNKVVQKFDTIQSVERKHELVSIVNDQTSIIKEVFTLGKVDWATLGKYLRVYLTVAKGIVHFIFILNTVNQCWL